MSQLRTIAVEPQTEIKELAIAPLLQRFWPNVVKRATLITSPTAPSCAAYRQDSQN